MSLTKSSGRRVTDFLRSRVGNLGISSLVLVVLEKMMDHDFVCPCRHGLNIVICVFYATVPSIACFAFTFCFVDTKSKGPKDKGNVVKCLHFTCSKLPYALLIVCIWLFLFFIDGRHVSCACSNWGGKYTETGALKWCKPNGSETVVFERLQKTHECITGSQLAGFVIALIAVVLAIVLAKCFHNEKYDKKGQDYEQAKGEII